MEIVDLGDGEIVLRRAETDAEPLVTIHFSDEARAYLMDGGLDVAKAMIQAGIESAALMVSEEEEEMDAVSESSRVLH
ncbi:MAG: hypothetical protein Hals2KO_02990 [Halioglobus sp.]